MFRQTLPRGFSRLGSRLGLASLAVLSTEYSVFGIRFLAPRGGSVAGLEPPGDFDLGIGGPYRSSGLVTTSYWVLRTGYWVLLRVAKSGLVVAKTMERFRLRLGWGGPTLLGLAVRQLTDRAGTTERRYRAFTGRPGPSGPWSSGRRGNPERANVSADAPSGFLAVWGSLRSPYLAWVLRTGYWVLGTSRGREIWVGGRENDGAVSACGWGGVGLHCSDWL